MSEPLYNLLISLAEQSYNLEFVNCILPLNKCWRELSSLTKKTSN